MVRSSPRAPGRPPLALQLGSAREHLAAHRPPCSWAPLSSRDTGSGDGGKGLVREEASQGGAKTWAWLTLGTPFPSMATASTIDRHPRIRRTAEAGFTVKMTPAAGLGLTVTQRQPLATRAQFVPLQPGEGGAGVRPAVPALRGVGWGWGCCRRARPRLPQLLPAHPLTDLLARDMEPQPLCWRKEPAATRPAVAGSVPSPTQRASSVPPSPGLPAPLGCRGSPSPEQAGEHRAVWSRHPVELPPPETGSHRPLGHGPPAQHGRHRL